MDASSILSHYQSLVRPKVESYLQDPPYPSQFSIPSKYKTDTDFHWQLMRDYPSRQSKYLRPTLIMLISEAMGKPNNLALATAAAMQMSEEWILIHDDWEDDSTLRRGKPCLHKLYSPELAMNTGDGLHVLMWSILMENFSSMEQPQALAIMSEFRTMLTRTVIGQTVEIKWMQENKTDLVDDDWYFVANSKTSYYSIAGPIRLGGLVAQASPTQLQGLSDLGNPLGYCFQLVDDILDLTSDFDGKKEAYGDIYEGKRTIMLGHLLRNSNPSDKKLILNILSKPRNLKSQDEVIQVVKLMHHYGSIEYGQKLAAKFKDQSLTIIKQLNFLSHQPARQHLEILSDYILTRTH
jgi:geranylgeranyl diphosphate synthase type II